MKAARLHGARDVRIEEVTTPAPRPGEVLVRVRAVSICASDWRLYADGDAGDTPLLAPIIQGHEFAGDVAALGEGVRAIAPGTRVAVEPSWHCGECDMCRAGEVHICRHVVFPSFPPHDGALAEYIACPAFSVHPLPESVGYAEGALTEPLGVAIHAVRLAQVREGERVVVLGAGAIGACTIRMARLGGAGRIAAVEPVAGRRECALEMGAEHAVASYQDLVQAGEEADVVFECSGDPAAVEQAMRLARPGGRAVIVGIPRPEQVTFEASVARRRELTVIFSRRSRLTLAEAVALAANGQAGLATLPLRRFTLDETQEAMEATGARPGTMLRAVVHP